MGHSLANLAHTRRKRGGEVEIEGPEGHKRVRLRSGEQRGVTKSQQTQPMPEWVQEAVAHTKTENKRREPKTSTEDKTSTEGNAWAEDIEVAMQEEQWADDADIEMEHLNLDMEAASAEPGQAQSSNQDNAQGTAPSTIGAGTQGKKKATQRQRGNRAGRRDKKRQEKNREREATKEQQNQPT